MKSKEIILKDICKYMKKDEILHLYSWYFKDGTGELCFQIKTTDEPYNGVILKRKDVKRLMIFITNFLNEEVYVRGEKK